MAVIISNGNTNLSTVNGFYRVEAYNLSTFSTTTLSTSSNRQINVTFSNAGNCQGLVLALVGSTNVAASTMKSVRVCLEQIMGTATLPVASPGVVNFTAHGFVAGQEVEFSTAGTLPTGVVAGTKYFVIAAGLTANAFEISATLGGSAINFTGTSSGTHTLYAIRTSQTQTGTTIAIRM